MLAIVYGCLGAAGVANTLSPGEVCIGILTIAMLAFIAAGMTAVYQVEKLPLPTKILFHGGVLYISYVLTYLLNGWLESQWVAVAVFTGIFLAGYTIIWLIIFLVEKAKADKLNKILKG